MPGESAKMAALNEVERGVITICCDGVRLIGMPKSVGEIYGLLFISRDPLSLDDLVGRLGISKGSVSQGLRTLRALGAVREVEGADSRRTYYEADIDLKQLVGGFIREQVRPHLQSGDQKLMALRQCIAAEPDVDTETKAYYEERVAKLEWWSKRARLVLPLLQKVLGS